MEILRKEEMLEFKNTVKVKNALMGSSADWTQPRKESVRLKRGQQNVPNMTCKKDRREYPRIAGPL